MRVTNKMLSNTFLSDMRSNLNNMQKLQQQLSSGKEIRKPSDDPFKVARDMQLTSDVNANKQYNENISDTINWLDTTDTALGQAGNILQRVRELVISAGNGSYSQQERGAIKDEINQKIGEFSQVLNTNFDGKYVFSGSRGNSKPVGVITNGTASNGAVINIKASSTPVVPGTSTASVSGTLAATDPDTTFKIEIGSITGSSTDKIKVSTSTDGGNTYSSAVTVSGTAVTGGYKFDLSTVDATKYAGMTFTIPDNVNNAAGDIFKFSSTAANSSNNTKLIYNSTDASAPELSVDAVMSSNTGNGEINKIGTKLEVEVSQGVNLEYNITASDVIQFTNETGETRDLRQIFSQIVNHLDGKSDDGTTTDATAVTKLNTTDLKAITDTMNNLLRLRSEVGAKQNRMDAAKERNEDENYNMTELLSNTEDIDITEKTMQFSNAQTVYLASLQCSAKVIQPSLLDYLR